MSTVVSNGKMIKTFPIIHCSPPPGKLAKGRKPISIGKKWPRSPVSGISHSLGLTGTSRGWEAFLTHPPLARQGGGSSWVGKHSFMRILHAQTDTHTPGLAPAPGKPTWACRAGEGGGQGPHSGWRGAISGSRRAEELPRNTWIFQFLVTTLGTTRVTGTKPTQAIMEGEVVCELFPLCLHYHGQMRVAWDADEVSSRYNPASLRTIFKNPAGIHWHFKMARGQVLAVQKLAHNQQIRSSMVKDQRKNVPIFKKKA